MKKTALLQKMLKERSALSAVGAYDAFTALLVERSGVDIVYLSGYMASATFLGLPDLGLITCTERVTLARQIARRVTAPVIADADEGYGNENNVMDTVEQFESAGVAGIHLDDEVFPGKCQTYDTVEPNPLISIEEMCLKIQAAVKARSDPEFLIIVRSDVAGSVVPGTVPRNEIVRQVVERSNAYARAGADMIFVYGETQEELDLYPQAIHAPLAGLLGFKAPHRMSDFAKRGYKMVICPLAVLCTAAKGVEEMLKDFGRRGEWSDMVTHMLSMKEIDNILSLSKYRLADTRPTR